jgi:hypothetical protein
MAGIVFLAIEVRQNQASLDEANRINRAASLRTAVEYFNEIRMSVATNAELADIWSRANSGEPLAGLEATRFESICQTLLWTHVMLYEQYRSLDQLTHLDGPLQSMRRNLQRPAIRECWESRVKDDVKKWGYGAFIEAL